MFARLIDPNALPREIQSPTYGTLSLSSGALTLGDQVEYFWHYNFDLPLAGDRIIKGSFHPKKKGRIHTKRWISFLEKRAPELASGWRSIVEKGFEAVQGGAAEYGYDISAAEVLPLLKVSHILICEDGPDEIGFEAFQPLETLDMRLVIGRGDRVVEVGFSG